MSHCLSHSAGHTQSTRQCEIQLTCSLWEGTNNVSIFYLFAFSLRSFNSTLMRRFLLVKEVCSGCPCPDAGSGWPAGVASVRRGQGLPHARLSQPQHTHHGQCWTLQPGDALGKTYLRKGKMSHSSEEKQQCCEHQGQRRWRGGTTPRAGAGISP